MKCRNFTLTLHLRISLNLTYPKIDYGRNSKQTVQCLIPPVNSAFQHCLQNWGSKDTKITFCCYVGFFSAFFLINSVILFYSWQPVDQYGVHLSFFSYFWLLNLVLSSTYWLYYSFHICDFPQDIITVIIFNIPIYEPQ